MGILERVDNLISKGKFYASTLRYPHRKIFPIIETGWTQETEEPYRRSRFCLVFRVPFTKPGFVLGVWGNPTFDETKALESALNTRVMTEEEWDEIFSLAYDKD